MLHTTVPASNSHPAVHRRLIKADGHFEAVHLNNYQHALMYFGVAVSGTVDLLGTRMPLPQGTEQVQLSAQGALLVCATALLLRSGDGMGSTPRGAGLSRCRGLGDGPLLEASCSILNLGHVPALLSTGVSCSGFPK
jgi:hypothetical protein